MHLWNCGTGCNSVLEMEHSGAFVQLTGLFAGLKGSVQVLLFFSLINWFLEKQSSDF